MTGLEAESPKFSLVKLSSCLSTLLIYVKPYYKRIRSTDITSGGYAKGGRSFSNHQLV